MNRWLIAGLLATVLALVTSLLWRQHLAQPLRPQSSALDPAARPHDTDAAVPRERIRVALEMLGPVAGLVPGSCITEQTQDETLYRPSLSEVVNLYLDEFYTRANPILRNQRASLHQVLRGILVPEGPAERSLKLLSHHPERRAGDFDYAVAAAMTLGLRALRTHDAPAAQAWATEALQLGPEVVPAHVFNALTLRQTGNPADALRALEHAHNLQPDEPAVALALGLALAQSPDAAPAAQALAVYLESVPQDRAVGAWHQRLQNQATLQAGFRRHQQRNVTLLSCPELGDHEAHAVLHEVVEALSRAAQLFTSPPRTELTAVVYASRSDLLSTTCGASWSGAVFDGSLKMELSSIRSPERRQQIIGHEAVHAQLHHLTPEAPTWLQEGVAQWLTEPRSESRLASYRKMVQQRVYIPFPSLAGSFMVIEDSQDALLAYHQSLAMVEALIARQGRGVLPRAVELLRRGTPPAELIQELTVPPLTGEELLTFLERQLSGLPPEDD